jgi:hypothetical protein
MLKPFRPPLRPAPRSGTAPPPSIDDLARLLPLWPHELSDCSQEGIEKRLALIRRALRAERQRGRQGHWAYDLGRHAALVRVYQLHGLQLTELKSRRPTDAGPSK